VVIIKIKFKNMKINKIINLLMVSLVLVLTSCEPMVDELHLKNNTTADNVELVSSQTTNGGNAVTLEMKTPGVTGYWDYMIGKGLTNRIDVVFPVTGTFDFKFVGTLGAEFFEKSTTVTIENLDTPADPEWAFLLGDDAVAGKTWVLAQDRPVGIDPYPQEPGMFSFMTAPYNWLELWWNASGCCPPEDFNAEMTFDLNGAPNYTYNNGGDIIEGSFVLDTKNATLTIQGADLVGAYGAPGQVSDTQNGLYQLKLINDHEMILYQIHGTGWTWIFKPKGYVY
jgi:hypothetical protein